VSAGIDASAVTIRRATRDDGGAIAAIWQAIVAERTFSAVDCPFTAEEERNYLQALSPREAVFVGETAGQQVVAFQSLDRYTKLFHSMDHVGLLGTFVLASWRGCGMGRQLSSHTFAFARAAGYEKLVIYVRASNNGARRFYTSLGFAPCGRLTRQVKIAGGHDDEILMETFL
jgi:ribosomal protein S18 acetylase RimI-like enzyme